MKYIKLITLFGIALVALSWTSAYASISISIQSLTPSTTINTGTQLMFNVVASGVTSPVYSLFDSFGGSTLSNSNISSNGNFAWAPTSRDIGLHTITVNVLDASNGNSTTVIEPITVNSPGTIVSGISIQSISPSTSLNASTTLTFKAIANGLLSPTFSLMDNFSNTTLTNSNIDSSGNFSWTPGPRDSGNHTITIVAKDLNGQIVSTTELISVNGGLSVTVQPPSAGSSVNFGAPVIFSISASGFINPSYTLTDSQFNSTVSSAPISASGLVTWTPTVGDVGVHIINATVTDAYGHISNGSMMLTVSGAAPITQPTPSPAVPPASSLGCRVGDTFSISTGLRCPPLPLNTGPAIPPILFTHYLTVGSKGIEVTELQKRLTTLKIYSGPITGTFGGLTRTAVKKFQSLHKLTQLGAVGPGTRAALNAGI